MTREIKIEKSQLGRMKKLGQGGSGIVYLVKDLRLPDFPGPFVYKEYNEKTVASAGPALGIGLANMVKFRDKLPQDQQRTWDSRIIWPVRVTVDEQGAATGIVMPLIPDRFFHNFVRHSGDPRRKPREIDTLFGDTPTMRKVGLPKVDVTTRLRLIRGIAVAYGLMHYQGVVLGDISARNVVYDADPARPAVLVVDIDSARVSGTRSIFSAQPHTQYWIPPEAQHAAAVLARKSSTLSPDEHDRLKNIWSIQSAKTDVYKFGLIVVRILDHRRQGAVNRDPATAMRILGKRVGGHAPNLLQRSLDSDPQARPTMREWFLTLSASSDESTSPKLSPANVLTQTLPIKPPVKPDIPAGFQKGNWVWNGQGWVRRQS